MKIHSQKLFIALAMFCAFHPLMTARAQGTAFTYQGRLNDGSAPANGSYDLTFSLFNVSSGGSSVAGPLGSTVAVSNGLFTTKLDFGSGVFNGAIYWLQIGVRTNGAASFIALTTRQELTPSPYAIFASSAASSITLSGTVPGGGLSGTYNGPVNFSNPADSFTGNGTGVTNVNAVSLNGLAASNFWQTAGNGNTSPANGNFLGTTDNEPLELSVNQHRALRLEPTAIPSAPNVIGGSSANFIFPGAVGSVIAGGGTLDDNGSVETNSINANYSLIGGGVGNTINPGSDYSLIGGGYFNFIDVSSFKSAVVGGEQNFIFGGADHSYLGGGFNNQISSGSYDTIGGGVDNFIDVFVSSSVISGGDENRIQGNSATVGGGDDNLAGNTYSTVGGGSHNVASGFSSTVAGGGEFFIAGIADKAHPNSHPSSGNTASGDLSSIGGGRANIASGESSTIAGGDANSASTEDATIGGGRLNSITNYGGTISGGALNIAGGSASVVSGGESNVGSGNYSTVGGGQNNGAGGAYTTVAGGGSNSANGDNSTVGGGSLNTAFGAGDTLAGGLNNSSGGGNVSTISGGVGNSSSGSDVTIGGGGYNTASATFSTISGGASNSVSADYATISGGYSNTVSGQTAFVAGGELNRAEANRTFAAGSDAQANHEGAFVWADYSTNTSVGANVVPLPFASSNRNEFTARATGGVRFVTAVDTTTGSVTAGVALAAGGTSWATISDRNAKKDFAPVNPETILNKLAAVPVEQWHYKWEDAATTPNIGPMAQDFIHAFYPGRNDKSITTLEFDGVELAAIQGLNQKLNDQLQAKDTEIENLKSRLEKLERLVEQQNSAH